MKKTKFFPILCALLAAAFYALSTPFSKFLLSGVSSAFLASLLYLGAGIGMGILYGFHRKTEKKEERLTRRDLPYTIAMIALDILAPLLLMFGLRSSSASCASLLGNFEIVATALISLSFFHEKISFRLWIAIGLITAASLLLASDQKEKLVFSGGSLLILLATCCWGLENNCTRSIAHKSTYEIVTLKGIGSGCGSLLIALLMGESFPALMYLLAALLLGFVSYGLSIFLYVRAQRDLGAAKTSAFYAIAPFIGAVLSLLLHGESLTERYLLSFGVMVAGTVFVVLDTLRSEHEKPVHTRERSS